jgi:predicted metal-dependent phosphotriesterase family hydrolase
MNKLVYVGLVVILAIVATGYYRNTVTERKQAYQTMSNEVEMAVKDMTAGKQTKEKLELRYSSFSKAMAAFSTKVRSSDQDILEKLKNAHNHLKTAIETFPPPMTEQEINDKVMEMTKQVNVTLERVDSSHMMYKTNEITIDGGKREEAINTVRKELEESTALCREVMPRLAKQWK